MFFFYIIVFDTTRGKLPKKQNERKTKNYFCVIHIKRFTFAHLLFVFLYVL